MNSKRIPLSVPNLKGNELRYVTKAIEDEWVSSGGPYVREFETKLSEYVHSKGAVACQNGTAGLHIALKICGIQKNDEVIVPTLTFIAAVNPIRYLGASPIFMDCDNSLCLDPVKLSSFCKNQCNYNDGILINKKTQKKISALVIVHVFGNMADMEPIMAIANTYGLKVIEDATEALGTCYLSGKYSGMYAGTIGDVGVYSFNGNKIITTGGGGMIVSNQDALLKHAEHLTTQAKTDELNYFHDEVGFNYRMTNLQAALGIAQLEQLENFIDIKIKNYSIYRDLLKDVHGVNLLKFRNGTRSNHWFYALEIECTDSLQRDEVIRKLNDNNIQTRPVWGLIHQQKPYLSEESYNIERAIYYWKRLINIPCSTNLAEEDVRMVTAQIRHIQMGEQ